MHPFSRSARTTDTRVKLLLQIHSHEAFSTGAKALIATPARVVVALNLVPQPGETANFSPEAHLDVLAAYAPGLCVDVVLADAGVVANADTLRAAAEDFGGRLVLAPVAMADGSPRHDPDLLAAAYSEIFQNDA